MGNAWMLTTRSCIICRWKVRAKAVTQWNKLLAWRQSIQPKIKTIFKYSYLWNNPTVKFLMQNLLDIDSLSNDNFYQSVSYKGVVTLVAMDTLFHPCIPLGGAWDRLPYSIISNLVQYSLLYCSLEKQCFAASRVQISTRPYDLTRCHLRTSEVWWSTISNLCPGYYLESRDAERRKLDLRINHKILLQHNAPDSIICTMQPYC